MKLLLFLLATAGPLLAQSHTGDLCHTSFLITEPKVLICTDPCEKRCTDAQTVNTNGGHTGLICSCDIIGPPANCCKLAYVPEWGYYDLVGACSLDHCTKGDCSILEIEDEYGQLVGMTSSCL